MGFKYNNMNGIGPATVHGTILSNRRIMNDRWLRNHISFVVDYYPSLFRTGYSRRKTTCCAVSVGIERPSDLWQNAIMPASAYYTDPHKSHIFVHRENDNASYVSIIRSGKWIRWLQEIERIWHGQRCSLLSIKSYLYTQYLLWSLSRVSRKKAGWFYAGEFGFFQATKISEGVKSVDTQRRLTMKNHI